MRVLATRWILLTVGFLALVVMGGTAPVIPAAGSVHRRDASPVAVLADAAIVESSGLAASGRTPGELWTHNDSGDGPILYATDRDGRARGRFAVTAAVNVDWEDMAAAAGAGGEPALYVADIGDNARARDDLVVYRVAEPAVAPRADPPDLAPVATAPAERFPFVYPDRHHDAESLLVDPRTGEMLVVTKEAFGGASLYRFPEPLTPGEAATLAAVGRAALPGVLPATGGAVSPDGSRLVLRTYATAYEWPVAPGQSLAAALAGRPRRLVLPSVPQGEAIAYRADGRALLFTSEGSPCPLHEVIVS